MSHSRWLIVGLGNPGAQYEGTRHNIGFWVIHHLTKMAKVQAKKESKFKALVAQATLSGGIPVILCQPLTYMNLSGESVKKLSHYYQISPEHILVIYDDTAIPFGKLRIRPNGSAGGHNGMKSIIQSIGGRQDFPRLRIGIGSPPPEYPLENYVLSKFSSEELSHIDKILETTDQAIEVILNQGVETAMNQFNGQEIL